MSAWTTSPLASVCAVFGDGDWIESKDQSPEGVRLIQTGNVGEGEFKDRVERARFVSKDTFARLRCTEIFAGDCLISRLPDPVGRACLIPETSERMITAVDCTIVRFDRNRMHPEFFAYYSQANKYLAAVEREATGTTRKRISRARLGQIPVPLAPVAEQRHIVALLNEAFEGITTARDNAARNLQNARDLFEGKLQSVFAALDASCPHRTFGSLASETHVGLTRSARQQGDNLRCRYVKMNNISADNRFDASRLTSVDANDAEVLRYRLQAGDFLFNTRNSHELVGKSCIFEGPDEDEVVFNNNIMRARFEAAIDAQFVLFAFSYKGTRDQLERMKSGTTNVSALYYRDLALLDVPTPDVTTQRRISNVLSTLRVECDRLGELQRDKLVLLERLKQSLLELAFNGGLKTKAIDSLLGALA